MSRVRRSQAPTEASGEPFFDAINRKDWPQVWAIGGSNLSPSYQEMVAGYDRTAHDDPAIYFDDGSLVRLVLLAAETTGATQLYDASYTVASGSIVRGSLMLQRTDSGSGFEGLAGKWGGHGRGLQITNGGLAVMWFRSYNDCGASPVQPCDSRDGDNLVDGGLRSFRLTSIDGASATGRAIGGTVRQSPSVVVRLDQSQGTVSVSGSEGAPFCNASAAPGTCGA